MAEFLQDLPCKHPGSFTEKESKSTSNQQRVLIAHDVPIEENEKVIKPETVPYFIKILHKSVLKNTDEAAVPETMSTSSKKRRHSSDDESPSSSSRRS